MNNKLLAFLFAVLLSFFVACEHETSSIGLNLIDQVGTEFSDTTTVVAFSVLEDTINTKNLSSNVLGNIYDPVFGDTKASIFAQFSLGGASVNFGTNPEVDSVVLTLQLSSYYGDTNSRVGFRVHRLTEALLSDAKYYQTSSVGYDPTPLNYTLSGYSVCPGTPVVVDTNTYNPHIRIRLSQAFGQYLLNNQANMGSNASFQQFFKGLCVEAISHTGNTGYMIITNLTSSLSSISLYYHNTSKASQKYDFVCNKDCVRFTRFEHNYNSSNNTDFIQEVLSGQQELGARTLFLQATGGVKTRVTFPHLQDAFKSVNNRVVINKAELVISDLYPEEQFLTHPAALSIQGIKTTDGNIVYLPDDEYYTSASYFGGYYDSGKHEYRFRITKYVQDLILGNSDLSNSINLVVKGSGVRANRLVFGGTGLNDGKRMRLELSYTCY